MRSCVIFGGAGFIGTHLARHLLDSGRFERVHIADLLPSPLAGRNGIVASITDVRQPIPANFVAEAPEWIFNFAAIHREPGHRDEEFFDTNLAGATNVSTFAEAVGCNNVYFTSSISVYGPTSGPTPETARICPITPYGGSKYPAEVMHHGWQQRGPGRRLVIVRPGVVYGPGDPGNMLRMIRAIKRGYFAFPGSKAIRKSYAYIYGMIDSIDFVMVRSEPVIVYNYVESPTEPLGELVNITKTFLGSSAPVFAIPMPLLKVAASGAQAVFGSRNPIHPARVRKAGMSTDIVPQWLIDTGFRFRYPFNRSLEHWRDIDAADFE